MFKLRLSLMVLISVFLFTPPARAELPQTALYNHNQYTPLAWQSWEAVTFDGYKDTVINGVATYNAGQFVTVPGQLLQVSGRCMLLTPAPVFNARLSVQYGGNLYPALVPLAFGNDRSVTFSHVFYSGNSFALQLYYDNVPVNSVVCNLFVEAVG